MTDTSVREPDPSPRESELGNTAYEIFVGALSALSLVNLVLVPFMSSTDIRNVVYFIDLLLSAIFLLDFALRLRRAPDKGRYFFRQWGWADLLASLPLPQVKVLRIFRLVRVARIMRRYGLAAMGRSLFKDRAGSALLTLLLVGILVLEFGSMLMIKLESGAPDANIKTASDALWYVIVTMSTVGYGDRYPVTNGGRELGSFIIVVGVGIFGTLTGYLANLFLSPSLDRRQAAEVAELEDPRASLARLKDLVAQQQAAIADLEAALDGH